MKTFILLSTFITSCFFASAQTWNTIVKVNFHEAGSFINVYPNPVTSQSFVLQMNNIKQGVYSLQIFSTTGEIVFTYQL